MPFSFHIVGTHEGLADNEATKGSSDRSFGLIFVVVFTMIELRSIISSSCVRWWSLAIALVFAGVALAGPSLLGPLNRLWTMFGLLLSRIVRPVVMGLLFFVVITPIALIMRATGKDQLHLEFDPKAKSYWIERSPPFPAPESIKNQF